VRSCARSACHAAPPHGLDGPGGVHAACIVDRAVQPAELRYSRGDEPFDLALHGDVGGDEQSTAAGRAQLFGGPLASVPAAPA